MFSFFKKKPAPEPVSPALPPAPAAVPITDEADLPVEAIEPAKRTWLDRLRGVPVLEDESPITRIEADGDLPSRQIAPPDAPLRSEPLLELPAAAESAAEGSLVPLAPTVTLAPAVQLAALPPMTPPTTALLPGVAPGAAPAVPPPAAPLTVSKSAFPPTVVPDLQARPQLGETSPAIDRGPAAPALAKAPAAPVDALPLPLQSIPADKAPAGAPIAEAPVATSAVASTATTADASSAEMAEVARRRWVDRLRGGLRKTGSSLSQVFGTAEIDDALYEELEAALLQADAGARATLFLLDDLRRRVKQTRTTDPKSVKGLLADAIADLLAPLESGLKVGEHVPTVMMVVGVNGAGKTTTIGKLTRHLAEADQKVLLAAADTFRAAAREQLAVWAGRNRVEIIGQDGGDPAAVTFDAVVAGKSRGCDVVIADTAGRLTTQSHLMDELKKIRRTIAKAQAGAPHEVLLVVDGNTGQNALMQVQAFDAALQLTGLVITKLDGTAKGGVLAAIALWSRDRVKAGGTALPVYFIGVGEKLEDLQTFNAREFARALLG